MHVTNFDSRSFTHHSALVVGASKVPGRGGSTARSKLMGREDRGSHEGGDDADNAELHGGRLRVWWLVDLKSGWTSAREYDDSFCDVRSSEVGR